MNKVLVGKKVIFFDVGYTIDYPASGDWMFTCKFNEIAGERIKGCAEDQIRQARNVGMTYLEKNHFIRDEKEEIANLYQYYKIISDLRDLSGCKTSTSEPFRDILSGNHIRHMAEY